MHRFVYAVMSVFALVSVLVVTLAVGQNTPPQERQAQPLQAEPQAAPTEQQPQQLPQQQPPMGDEQQAQTPGAAPGEGTTAPGGVPWNWVLIGLGVLVVLLIVGLSARGSRGAERIERVERTERDEHHDDIRRAG
ncbi:MAG: hypothetical protein HYX72_15405 [Acidobacteria bacterium]|nr:hypothetical protein [Acidobacteriota bacterium]